MTKFFCDICGKEIDMNNEKWSKYKLKKEYYSFDEHWWARLIVHDECWHNLNKFLDGNK